MSIRPASVPGLDHSVHCDGAASMNAYIGPIFLDPALRLSSPYKHFGRRLYQYPVPVLTLRSILDGPV